MGVPGVARRRVWADKRELLDGGADVEALRYQRASKDAKKQEISVTDQAGRNLREIERYGWSTDDSLSFTDNHKGASRHSRGVREDYERLMDVIAYGRGDVLVLWELTRGQRDLAVYVAVRDLCTKVGLFFWMVGSSLYDLRDRNDRMSLGIQAVQAEAQADSIQANVLRGVATAASLGKPHGREPYGYTRTYHGRTRALVSQHPDPEVCVAVGVDGTETEYRRPEIVAEIFARVAGSDSLTSIVADLNSRGVAGPTGGHWTRVSVTKMVRNPAYIGKRQHHGEVVADAVWKGLVDDDVFWACVRLLGDPTRKSTRPARAVHLLSYVATCGVCGAPLAIFRRSRRGDQVTPTQYSCRDRRCVSAVERVLDDYVEAVVVSWLSRTDVYGQLAKSGVDSDRKAAQARAEASRLRAELEQWRALAESGQVQPVSFARAESGLLPRIAAADEAAAQAATPPVLRGLIGPDAATKWQGLEIAVKREVVRLVCGGTADAPCVLRLGLADRRRNPAPIAERVTFGGFLAPVDTATG